VILSAFLHRMGKWAGGSIAKAVDTKYRSIRAYTVLSYSTFPKFGVVKIFFNVVRSLTEDAFI